MAYIRVYLNFIEFGSFLTKPTVLVFQLPNMNANCHKTVFSKRLGMLVAVGEHASSTGKAASGQGPCGSAVIDGFVGALRLTFASTEYVRAMDRALRH